MSRLDFARVSRLDDRGAKTLSHGLTLMELVIVLAILAATATAAAVATERVLLFKRNEITANTLDAFRRSLLGRYGQAETVTSVSSNSTAPSIDGFIADLGRLPMAIGTEPSTQLAELWSPPPGVQPYGLKSAGPSDPDVTLSCGWRGPYLDLPIGSTRLLDGFGRDLVVLSADGAGNPQVAATGQAVLGLTSLGSDGEMGVVNTELPLAEDLTVWLGSTNAYLSDLTIRVYELDADGNRIAPSQDGSLLVRLYLPDASTGDLGFQQSPILTTPSPATFNFPDVPIGPKVLRAYWTDGGSASVLSSVVPIEVRRGGATSFDLVLSTLPVPSAP